MNLTLSEYSQMRLEAFTVVEDILIKTQLDQFKKLSSQCPEDFINQILDRVNDDNEIESVKVIVLRMIRHFLKWEQEPLLKSELMNNETFLNNLLFLMESETNEMVEVSSFLLEYLTMLDDD